MYIYTIIDYDSICIYYHRLQQYLCMYISTAYVIVHVVSYFIVSYCIQLLDDIVLGGPGYLQLG